MGEIYDMLRVCHISSAHSRYDTRIFHKECKSLANEGYDVVLLVADNGDTEIKDGVKIVSVKLTYRNRLDRFINAKKVMFEAAVKINADVYHFHDPELLQLGNRLKKMGNKVIFDSHEDVAGQIMSKSYIPFIFRSLVSKIYRVYQNHICRGLDAVISVTPHICKEFKSINPNTYMITNYPIVIQKNYYGYNQHVKTICFAGGISEQWGHETILRALEICKDVKYVLCGKGSDAYMESLKCMSAWERVEYKGKVPHTEVANILSSASVGIALLSYSKNTAGKLGTIGNTKLFEYMSAGIPVICTDFHLWKEIIEEHKCGVCIPPGNEIALSKAINYIMDKREIAKEMGKNGQRAIFEKYNWGNEEKKLLELYKQISKN